MPIKTFTIVKSQIKTSKRLVACSHNRQGQRKDTIQRQLRKRANLSQQQYICNIDIVILQTLFLSCKL